VTASFLDTVMTARKAALDRTYGTLSPADLERIAAAAPRPRDFAGVLTGRPDIAVIAEVKKASPSAGPIAPDCDASMQAMHYQGGGAACISVLCEPDFFAGSFTDLSDVSDAVDIPVLAKDFVVDPIQLYLARSHGADAVLLMVSVLGESVREYLDLATTLGLASLVEVHDEDELRIALSAQARLIGVNSRNLKTLEVAPEKVGPVIAEAKASGAIVVAESGMRNRASVQAAAACGADAVLVGEILMRASFPEDVLELLTGVAKTR
jgi:indole-3-glycerol phosphate synthase